jgi:hypothetical protein
MSDMLIFVQIKAAQRAKSNARKVTKESALEEYLPYVPREFDRGSRWGAEKAPNSKKQRKRQRVRSKLA